MQVTGFSRPETSHLNIREVLLSRLKIEAWVSLNRTGSDKEFSPAGVPGLLLEFSHLENLFLSFLHRRNQPVKNSTVAAIEGPTQQFCVPVFYDF